MYNKSETISELTKALCKVQGEMKSAKKDSDNPFYKSRYADLASCWETCRALLTSNGLTILQPINFKPEGVVIETVLAHVSGEWVSGELLMPITEMKPQAVGSLITYGRRYGLCAMVGIVADDDDDAEMASGRGNKQQEEISKAATKVKSSQNNSTASLRKKLFAKLTQDLGMSAGECQAFMTFTLGRAIEDSSTLTTDELVELMHAAVARGEDI